jgi:Tfp pilus assembly protein PilZ
MVGTRVNLRFKKRVPCRLKLGQQQYSGLVLDVSRTGLFVQTSATPRSGDEIEVVLSQPKRNSGFALTARVVWQRRVPSPLRRLVEGGVGLEIRYAPESYFALLSEAALGLSTSRRGDV